MQSIAFVTHYNPNASRNQFRALIFLLVVFFFNGNTINASEIEGLVVHIADGDTLTILTASKKQVKIRLAEIDAPERKQPFGNKAKTLLANLTFQKEARIEVAGLDRYGRSIGRVFIKNTDINAELVNQGMAWVYRKYSNDQGLINLESLAKRAKRGLWSVDNPIAPWEWRKGHRNDASGTTNPNLIIGNKRSKIYHLSNCRSYYKILKKNQNLFASEEIAKEHGYKKAGNCL